MGKSVGAEKFSKPSDSIAFRMKYHPLKIFVYLILVGASSAFGFLSLAYFLSTFGTSFNHFQLPYIFHANTLLMLVSSYAMMQTYKAMQADDWKEYVRGLLVTGVLAIAFTIFQIEGWNELMAQGISLKNNIAGAYLYLISGLHIAHLVFGIVWIGYFALKALEVKDDPVKLLIYESNPLNKMKIGLLTTYWHFVDGLWCYLYLFFLFNIYVLTKGSFHPIY